MRALDNSTNPQDFRRSWLYWANIHGYYGQSSPDGTVEDQIQYLKQNGFAARDYMIGFTALSMAYTIASGSNAPDYVASPANVAFAKSNPQLLRELLAVLRVDTSKK